MFLISVRSLFHNLGADKVKARPAVLLSALEIVFGTNKEILSIYVRLRSITFDYRAFDCLPGVNTVFSQLDAHCVYLKLGHIDPLFKRGRRLIGARRLFTA